MDTYRIEMEDVVKSFGGIHALKGVTFRAKAGEIHALVGENGAGKSTLMKILAGAYQKDAGVIRIDGKEVAISTPKRGRELGIGIVYQEFELAPDITVAENIFLDKLSHSFGLVNWKEINQKTKEIIDGLGFHISPQAITGDLPVASQQIVEIAKALAFHAKILILDEPTAVLSDNEVVKLFETLMKLKSAGVCIIYISHRMQEIFQIADTITTLRDGTVTGSMPREGAQTDDVIELMIGGRLGAMFPKRDVTLGEEVLRVENLSGPPKFSDVSFSLRRGEVLGIAGLVGSGRTEVLRAIFGGDGRQSGQVWLRGQAVHVRSPHTGVRHGIALVPENRKDQGLVIDKPISENMTMAALRKVLGALGVILFQKENAIARNLCGRLSVKAGDVRDSVNSLSGGNQQKVVLAKWFNTECDVILLDEPTRGVDVGAKTEIYRLINEFAAHGLGVVFVSSEMPEIIGMCDRALVMAKGVVMEQLKKEDLSEANILRLAVGGGVQ
ncbi:MAG: sugar ABC transporter ATP-binding protein [Oscillospiraceae bacterium]|nr:sugar ABC transporter ATP-binding protein [Oscillospiraceae bacterium]